MRLGDITVRVEHRESFAVNEDLSRELFEFPDGGSKSVRVHGTH